MDCRVHGSLEESIIRVGETFENKSAVSYVSMTFIFIGQRLTRGLGQWFELRWVVHALAKGSWSKELGPLGVQQFLIYVYV